MIKLGCNRLFLRRETGSRSGMEFRSLFSFQVVATSWHSRLGLLEETGGPKISFQLNSQVITACEPGLGGVLQRLANGKVSVAFGLGEPRRAASTVEKVGG